MVLQSFSDRQGSSADRRPAQRTRAVATAAGTDPTSRLVVVLQSQLTRQGFTAEWRASHRLAAARSARSTNLDLAIQRQPGRPGPLAGRRTDLGTADIADPAGVNLDADAGL